MTLRPELVQSAVLFLKDPKAQSAPLQQQNDFLVSKGLTPEEIQEARVLAAGTSIVPPLPARPSPPKRTWKDVIIGTLGIGAVLVGAVHATWYFLGPLVDFPTAKKIEKDSDNIKSELQNSSKLISTISEQTAKLAEGVEKQQKSVAHSLGEMEIVLAQIGDEDNKRRLELKNIKSDVEQLKELLPQVSKKSNLDCRKRQREPSDNHSRASSGNQIIKRHLVK